MKESVHEPGNDYQISITVDDRLIDFHLSLPASKENVRVGDIRDLVQRPPSYQVAAFNVISTIYSDTVTIYPYSDHFNII